MGDSDCKHARPLAVEARPLAVKARPLAVKRDVWWKWVVLVAVYSASVIVAASTFSAGVMYVALLDRFGGDKAKTSLVASLGSAFLSLLAPIGGFVVNTFSCRVSVILGGICLSMSGLLSAFAPDLDALLFTHGVLGGIGYALIFPVTTIILGFYFDKHRNLVISMSVAMVGFGMFAAAPLTLALLDTFALSGTYLVYGALSAQLCIVGVLCKPSPLEIKVQTKRLSKQTKYTKNAEEYHIKFVCASLIAIVKTGCDISVFKNLPFVIFQISNFTWTFMMMVCVVHFPNYVIVHGASEDDITLLMSCFSISNGCGRFLAALTVDANRLKDKSLFIQMCMLGIMGTASVLFPLYSHFESSKYMFAFITGICTGGPNALITPITISLVGLDRLSNAHGFCLFCCGLGSLTGPPIAGLLFGCSGSYKYSFIFGGCVCLVGAVLSCVAQVLHKRANDDHKHPLHQDQRLEGKVIIVDTEAVKLLNETPQVIPE